MIERLFELSHYYLRKHNKPFKRDFLRNPLQSRISIVTGQRGVGKTTALIQHLLNLCNHDPFTRKGLYVPADHTLIARYTPYEIAATVYKEGVKLIFFDDIHKYPEWHRDVKHIYHVYPDLKLFISGCAAKQTHENSHEMKRRTVAYRMKGFSFQEFIAAVTAPKIQLKRYTLDEIIDGHETVSLEITATLEKKETDILPLFRDYLRFGYYPGFMEHPEDRETLYLEIEENVRKIATNDSVDVNPNWNGADIRNVLKLFGLLIETIPCLPDLDAFQKKVGAESTSSLSMYLKFLEDSEVIRRIPGKEEGGELYLDNTNLAYALEDSGRLNTANIHSTFFAGAVSPYYKIQATTTGNFLVDDKYTLNPGEEIDGKIPLWLFGFLR